MLQPHINAILCDILPSYFTRIINFSLNDKIYTKGDFDLNICFHNII